MIWYKVWYKLATITLSNHPVSVDLVPYSNKPNPSTHRNLMTSKKALKVSLLFLKFESIHHDLRVKSKNETCY